MTKKRYLYFKYSYPHFSKRYLSHLEISAFQLEISVFTKIQIHVSVFIDRDICI